MPAWLSRARLAVTALVTGGASGIGRALVDRLGDDVVVLDLAEGHDVSDPGMWRRVEGDFDVACLNAGVVTGVADLTALTDEMYRRIVGTNVDGVVFSVRELASRLMPAGGSICVTASLAGLGPMPSDPVYSLTKHALVGFVRSVAPQLEARGIRINAVCPGIVDTPLLDGGGRAALERSGFPLLAPGDVADAALVVLRSGETGQAWAIQPGRDPVRYEFRGVPGPRVAGAEGVRPPL